MAFYVYDCALVLGPVYISQLKQPVLKLSSKKWEIDWDDIDFPEPKIVIGRGGSAEVLRAQWNGTDVAVKRLLGWEVAELGPDDSAMARTGRCKV